MSERLRRELAESGVWTDADRALLARHIAFCRGDLRVAALLASVDPDTLWRAHRSPERSRRATLAGLRTSLEVIARDAVRYAKRFVIELPGVH